MVSVTLGGIRKAAKMEQVLRDGEVYRELTAKLPEIAHKKKKSKAALYFIHLVLAGMNIRKQNRTGSTALVRSRCQLE